MAARTSKNTIRVEGLAGLQRAFAAAEGSLDVQFKGALKDAAEPVAVEAQARALSSIRKMTGAWSEMRIGVTRRSVYVAPSRRAVRGPGKRRNLADLLLGRAMEPALESNVPEVVREVDRALATIGAIWERTP